MYKQYEISGGFFINIDLTGFTLPDELREFLQIDDQGIEGFDFMLKNPELSKRIPVNIRYQYELLYGQLMEVIQASLDRTKEEISKVEKNPRESIHELIQALTENENTDDN